jgi:hypothetical protein
MRKYLFLALTSFYTIGCPGLQEVPDEQQTCDTIDTVAMFAKLLAEMVLRAWQWYLQ